MAPVCGRFVPDEYHGWSKFAHPCLILSACVVASSLCRPGPIRFFPRSRPIFPALIPDLRSVPFFMAKLSFCFKPRLVNPYFYRFYMVYALAPFDVGTWGKRLPHVICHALTAGISLLILSGPL